MIEAVGLTMRYGPVVALADAGFSVAKGEVVGLLGPNGAGKSTTMKILTTFLVPTAGTATIGGFSIAEQPLAVRQITGYMPETPPLYLDMEVDEYLAFIASARGVPAADRAARRQWVVERCGLAGELRTPIRNLSKGFRQRTALAQALIHDPAALILDEPTSGLDPHQIREIRGLIRELAKERAVILSTHVLSEAEAMADRIVIINRGRIVGQGTLPELRKRAGEGARVRVAVQATRADSEAALKRLDAVRDCALVGEKGGVQRYTLRGNDEAAILRAVGQLANEKHWPLVELSPSPYTLEDTFVKLTAPASEQKAEAAAS